MWSIIVHGGAGAIPESLASLHRAGCAEAADVGAECLDSGGSALDAACAAVRVLESNPLFNSGRGSTLDARGLPLMDAAVARASDLAYGAVGQVLGVGSPVDLARAVLEDGRHCLLVGSGAVDFARRTGIRLQDPELDVTETARAAWRRAKEQIGRAHV